MNHLSANNHLKYADSIFRICVLSSNSLAVGQRVDFSETLRHLLKLHVGTLWVVIPWSFKMYCQAAFQLQP